MGTVTRKAVLIGCPGEGKGFLAGVKKDLKNIEELLLSERAGSFYTHEIITLINPTKQQIAEVIYGTYSDYSFIYFSGHGFTNRINERMIACGGFNLPDTCLLSNSPRALVMIDCCRNYTEKGAAIGGFGDKWNNATGSATRELFDYFIANSPHGKVIIHATAEGTYSYDSPTGGVFTNKWLYASNTYYTQQGYAGILISRILQDVHIDLQLDGSGQVPCVVYQEGDFRVPFAIAKPEEKGPAINYPTPSAFHTDKIANGWLALGVWGLGLLVFGLLNE